MTASYFLGTGSPNGFLNCFCTDSVYTYILKGGPGTGKSSLMKKVSSEMKKNDIDCEKFYCSSDPDSLDAVYFPSLKISIIDGTAPHTADPDYAGVTAEIINLGEFWNKDNLLKKKNEIISVTDKNRELHAKAKRFIASAFSLYSDGEKICMEYAEKEKICRYASRMANKKIKRLSSKIGREEKRLMTAISPKGCIFADDTVKALCDERIILDDTFGTAANILIKEIRDHALASGFDVTVSPYISDGKSPRYIIIKELSLGIFTRDIFFKPDIIPTKIISMRRFYDCDNLREHRSRLNFIKKASAELMDEACSALAEAKKIHDEIEKYYIDSMNFEKLDSVTENLRKEIWAAEWQPEN